jgi:hypothetical protein
MSEQYIDDRHDACRRDAPFRQHDSRKTLTGAQVDRMTSSSIATEVFVASACSTK